MLTNNFLPPNFTPTIKKSQSKFKVSAMAPAVRTACNYVYQYCAGNHFDSYTIIDDAEKGARGEYKDDLKEAKNVTAILLFKRGDKVYSIVSDEFNRLGCNIYAIGETLKSINALKNKCPKLYETILETFHRTDSSKIRHKLWK